MIEIDNNIVDPAILLERVRKNVLHKKVDNFNVTTAESSKDSFRIGEQIDEAQIHAGINLYEPISSHRKILGPVIVFFRKVFRRLIRFYAISLTNQQTRFNSAVVRSLNEINNKLNHIDNYRSVMSIYNTRLEEFTKSMEVYPKLIDDIKEAVASHDSKYSELIEIKDKIEELEESFCIFNNGLEKLNNEIDSLKIGVNFDKLQNENDFLSSRIRRIERKVAPVYLENKKVSPKEVTVSYGDFDYLTFEQKFRGSEAEIKNRQQIYLDYFKNKNNVLDIGCGRGEFLELMSDNGISAKGVELSRDFVQICEDKCLDVIYSDAIEYLDTLEDKSLGGVIISHVVEHLDIPYISHMLELLYEKMQKSSYIILETPNPRTIAIFRNSFYMDPTHIKPIHPELLKFMVSSAGFREAQEKTYPYSKENFRIPALLGENISNLGEFNQSLNVLNDVLFGFQDYTITAIK